MRKWLKPVYAWPLSIALLLGGGTILTVVWLVSPWSWRDFLRRRKNKRLAEMPDENNRVEQ